MSNLAKMKTWSLQRFTRGRGVSRSASEKELEYTMILLNVPIEDVSHFDELWAGGDRALKISELKTKSHSKPQPIVPSVQMEV